MVMLHNDAGIHVVIRNTFLEFSDDSSALESHDPFEPLRVRACTDMTDSKLPMKVELSNSGVYQVSRHRLSSTMDGTSPMSASTGNGFTNDTCVSPAKVSRKGSPKTSGADKMTLQTVMEEFDLGSDLNALLNSFEEKADIPLLTNQSPQLPTPDGLGVPSGNMASFNRMPPPPAALPPHWWNSLALQVPPPPGILPSPNLQAMQPPPGSFRQPARSPGIESDVSPTKESGGNCLQLAELLPEKKENHNTNETTLTTIMMRNIPINYTRSMLLDLLDSAGFHGKYDFVYLPMDFRNGVNLAYAFVNMTSHQDADGLTRQLHGYTQWGADANNGCDISWAHPNQGLKEHVERYRNSPVMHPSTPEEYKPLVFKNGRCVRFPSPTKQIKAPRIKQAPNGCQKGHEVAREAQKFETLGMPNFVAVCA